MRFMPLHHYGLMWRDGAYIFASAAAHADFVMHMRDIQALLFFAERQHFYGLHGTMLSAGGAVCAVGFDYTEILVKNCRAYLYMLLCGKRYGLYCACGADFGAFVASV